MNAGSHVSGWAVRGQPLVKNEGLIEGKRGALVAAVDCWNCVVGFLKTQVVQLVGFGPFASSDSKPILFGPGLCALPAVSQGLSCPLSSSQSTFMPRWHLAKGSSLPVSTLR